MNSQRPGAGLAVGHAPAPGECGIIARAVDGSGMASEASGLLVAAGGTLADPFA